MTQEELIKELESLSKDDLSKILDKYKGKDDENPPTPSPNPPTPTPQPEPKKDVKSDSVITMTAAEFMQVISNMKKSEDPKKKEKGDDEEDDEIFI